MEAGLNGSAPRRAADPSRGTNQSGVRLYNERLILSLVRRHGSLPKVEISRLTGLSVQTIAGIMNRLEADGLLLKLSPQRGRVGQPAVPFALNPSGAFSAGLKIGRRSSELVLIDFVGEVRRYRRWTYPYPVPERLLELFREALDAMAGGLPEEQAGRVAGLGLAIPFELWSWGGEIGAPPEVMRQWQALDLRSELAKLCGWPVYLCNDATAACAAELVFGQGGRYHDFIYLFVGSFVGGGIVLDGTLYPGRTGNAGALGSMPINGGATERRLGTQQLIRSASLHVLERKLAAAGADPARIWATTEDWDGCGAPLDEWIGEAASSLAQAVVAAAAVIDFEAAVLDGAFPPRVRARLVREVAREVEALDRRGLSPMAIVEGSIGGAARAIGGATLPLLASFARDREVLFKEVPDGERHRPANGSAFEPLSRPPAEGERRHGRGGLRR